MGESRTSLQRLLLQLPRPASADWPEGEPFVDALRHGTMSLEIFAPRGIDRQSPHEQDELYIVVTGEARFNQAETGHGVALLRLAEDLAGQAGLTELRLYTNARMERNVALYTSFGYRETGRRPNPFRPGWTVVDMAKTLAIVAPPIAG
jgi:GNAT superfamily N-acetyltransferase